MEKKGIGITSRNNLCVVRVHPFEGFIFGSERDSSTLSSSLFISGMFPFRYYFRVASLTHSRQFHHRHHHRHHLREHYYQKSNHYMVCACLIIFSLAHFTARTCVCTYIWYIISSCIVLCTKCGSISLALVSPVCLAPHDGKHWSRTIDRCVQFHCYYYLD